MYCNHRCVPRKCTSRKSTRHQYDVCTAVSNDIKLTTKLLPHPVSCRPPCPNQDMFYLEKVANEVEQTFICSYINVKRCQTGKPTFCPHPTCYTRVLASLTARLILKPLVTKPNRQYCYVGTAMSNGVKSVNQLPFPFPHHVRLLIPTRTRFISRRLRTKSPSCSERTHRRCRSELWRD